MAAKYPTPDRSAFTSPNETIVYVDPGQRPDDYNRLRFTAFWQTNQEWSASGVNAQLFYSDLDRFITNAEKDQRSVRVVRDLPPTGGAR
jgi:hypothetical protein